MKNQSLLHTFTISALDETQTWALKFAHILQKGDIIALQGDLGVGKTTFCRFLIQGLNPIFTEIPSPTFTLVQTYEMPKGSLWHFDCYRLNRPEDAIELGIEEAFHTGISLIEWPEKISPLLPPSTLFLTFELHLETRTLKIFGDSTWTKRLNSIFYTSL